MHLLLKKKITSIANFRGVREEYRNIEDVLLLNNRFGIFLLKIYHFLWI